MFWKLSLRFYYERIKDKVIFFSFLQTVILSSHFIFRIIKAATNGTKKVL